MAAVLEIIEGPGAGTTYDISGAIEMGRDPSAGIVLQDAEVSRKHARLSPTPNGILVEDLGSRNGTYVNDQPVQGVRELRPGDELRAGVTVFALQGDRQLSGVRPVPQITNIGAQVLQPVAVQELPPVPPQAAPVAPPFRAPETEPGYIPGGRSGGLGPAPALGGAPQGDIEAGEEYQRVAALRDPRVKPQTKVAAAGFILIAVLALIVYFGVTS
jgi:hypothetical protein